MLKTIKRKFIGSKEFYKSVLAILLPIVLQNAITTFVNLLDNFMVGSQGTEAMSGVAVVNQLVFVYNLCIFGGLAGAGIFSAQYYGNNDPDGIRYCFRFKLIACTLIWAVATAVLVIFHEPLLKLFLNEGGNTGNLELAYEKAKEYLFVILFTLLPFYITMVYTSTLRETGETLLPMKSGLVAVGVNLLFNTLLIYGYLGFPALGVKGAALGTLIARLVEVVIIVCYTHKNKKRFTFIEKVYKTLKIPKRIFKKILAKGVPLFLNEVIWSLGTTAILYCYSLRGLSVVAAFNISNSVNNLFSIVFISMGTAIAIMVGSVLGEGDKEKAKDTDTKLLALSISVCFILALIMIALSPVIPKIYNTTAEVRSLATRFMMIVACFMPVHAFMHGTYFTLRAGGKTLVTFIFDSGAVSFLALPVAFVLAKFTALSIEMVYFLVLAVDLIKVVFGIVLLKKGVWLNNLVKEDKIEETKENVI